jgi:hypothetical protein
MAANPPESRIPGWAVLAMWTEANLSKDIFSAKIHPLDPGDHMLSQKLLEEVGVETFVTHTVLPGCLNPQYMSPILQGSLLSPP